MIGRRPRRFRGFMRWVGGLAWGFLAWAAAAAPPVIPSTVKASIQQRVDYGYNVGITVGMVTPGGRAYYNYGRTAYGSGGAPDERTLYEIGSITKVFTSTLLAEMTARGEVALEDGVETLLPEGFRIPVWGGEVITLEQLATHTSALPANPPFEDADPVNPFAGITAQVLRDYLGAFVLTRRPGSEWEYSNLGVGLLGHALASRLGLEYGAALGRRILEPLGMEHTTLTLSGEQMPRRAVGHSGVVTRPPFEMGSLEGAGALRSSAGDLLLFLEYQLGFRPTALSEVLMETRKARFNAPGFRMGLGWLIVPAGAASIYMHDGATLGQTAFVGFDPGSRIGVVVLTNSRLNKYSGVTDIGLKLLVPAASLTPIFRPADVPVETLRSLYGRFVADDGTRFEVGLQRQHLTVAFSGDGGVVFTLYPQTTRRFLFLDATTEASATFQLGADGLPVSLTWAQSGIRSTYRKQSVPSRLGMERQAGRFLLSLTGGDTGIEYVVEGSDDLQHWEAVSSVTLWEPAVVDLADPAIGRRFYRSRTPE